MSTQRVVAAVLLLASIPLAHEADAVVTVATVAAVLWGLLTFESVCDAEVRNEVRHAGHTHDRPV